MRLIDKNPPAQISKDVRIPVGKVFLLARRLVGVTQWVGDNPETENLQVGYLGASAGAGALP